MNKQDKDNNNRFIFKQKNWSIETYKALNDFIKDKGIESPSHTGNEYAVFDFDNTVSIHDSEETLAIYQIEHMAFAFDPERIDEILSSGLKDLSIDLKDYGYPDITYQDIIDDIHDSYRNLYQSYGPFDSKGVSPDILEKLHQSEDYKEFSVKICVLYEIIGYREEKDVSYPWLTYLFYGMSEEEIYHLAYLSHSYHKDQESKTITWKTAKKDSKAGILSYSFAIGLSVTEEVKDLIHTLKENDITVWICSASDILVVLAAIDVFSLHDDITGVIGMTNVFKDDKQVNQYDYEGRAYLVDGDHWIKDTIPGKAQTQREGKVIAIDNILVSRYHHGPDAGFMDASADFCFCSEYRDLSLVVCFNRGDRKVTDGGGLIAETAIYQREHLGYDYHMAKKNHDIYYVLQGRDENGYRGLRNSDKSLLLDSEEERLFAGKENQIMLDHFLSQDLTTEEILNRYSLITEKSDEFPFRYGFMKEYHGYRKR